MPNDRNTPSTRSEYESPQGCLLRLLWMGLGNVALVLTALWIYRSAGWSIADILFAVIVLVLIGARYVDIVRYRGSTADGNEPATMAHWKRYALTVAAVAAALWVVARALGKAFSIPD